MRYCLKKLTNLSYCPATVIDGYAYFGQDLYIGGTVSGNGTLDINGSLNAAGKFEKPANVILTSKAAQSIRGGTLNFQNLTIHNTSKFGVRFESTAYV